MSDEARAIRLRTPVLGDLRHLESGSVVWLSGKIYTARDAAHKRMAQAIVRGEDLPFDPNGQILYYTGPTPSREGQIIGSAGPTSSYRMDPYTPALLRFGLKGCIGKGERSRECMQALEHYGARYFLATGGTGALISACVQSVQIVAYPDLGAEAICELEVENMRLIVA